VKIKILFICGSLDPGNDGVGDYTRRLAGEVIRKGHDAVIISLHERNLDKLHSSTDYENHEAEGILDLLKLLEAANWISEQNVRSCYQEDVSTLIPVLRLGSGIAWRRRGEIIEDVYKAFHPDYISLQFVSYAYQNKGMPIQFIKLLIHLNDRITIKWHIMFHELWLGIASDHNFLSRLIGFFQRLVIRVLLTRLNPAIVHTSVKRYQAFLAEIGTDAFLLPIFSNIPVSEKRSPRWNSRNKKYLNIGIFGSINSLWNPSLLLKALEEYKINTNWFLIGRNGSKAELLIDQLKLAYGVNSIHRTGKCTASDIDRWLNHLDLGLATCEAELCQRSGVVAAYAERGIPVLFLRGERIEVDDSIKQMQPITVSISELRIFPQLQNPKNKSSLTIIADRFINDLQKKT